MPPESTRGGVLLDDVARFLRRFVVLTDDPGRRGRALDRAHARVRRGRHDALPLRSPAPRSAPARPACSRCSSSSCTRPADREHLRRGAFPRDRGAEADAAARRGRRDLRHKAREREDLRGLLNAGYRRGAVVRRMGGAKMTTLEAFPVFCAKAFAGIGNCLPDTILDRSITIALQAQDARGDGRAVPPPRRRPEARASATASPTGSSRSSTGCATSGRTCRTSSTTGRRTCGSRCSRSPTWPAVTGRNGHGRPRSSSRQRRARGRLDDRAAAARHLHRLRERRRRRLRTADLIDAPVAIEESPWGDWYGKPISPQASRSC